MSVTVTLKEVQASGPLATHARELAAVNASRALAHPTLLAQSTRVVSGAVQAASAITKDDTPFDSRNALFSSKVTLGQPVDAAAAARGICTTVVLRLSPLTAPTEAT